MGVGNILGSLADTFNHATSSRRGRVHVSWIALLLLATSILLTDPPESDPNKLNSFFVGLGRRFFLFFALLQVWIIGVGFTMTNSFIATDIVNAVFLLLAVSLASSARERFHNVGALLVWGSLNRFRVI